MTTRIAPGVGANLLGQHSAERNQDATAYVGNLDPQTSEELLWELFVQAGPVVNVYVPKDRVTNLHQGYGFVEFRSEDDADYAIKVLNMIKLYGKPIRVNKASQDKKSLDVGANLFVGNLDPDVDEKLLYDTFSAFGVIVTNPKIMRDPETGNSRGFGFVSYDSFEASDGAIEAMNGQYLCNRQITVSYAYKKDTKGERHGTPAERVLAASNTTAQRSRPHTLFASGPPTLPNAPPPHQANGMVGLQGGPPRPFVAANGGMIMAPPPMAVARPPPPNPAGMYQQQLMQQQQQPIMQMSGHPPPPQMWQGQPQQQQQPIHHLPPQFQQFRPPPPNMPPPQQMQMQMQQQQLPPPSGMVPQQMVWRPPPPPQQQQQMPGRPPMMQQQMSMAPPPPPSG
ncbi:splicing factor 3B subunit 4 [Impatiens glandulifera]|uniref:splicing factor 3B subunit 4 n=1 Tax=Impatiens glandulifera TaxID=253017 RepID=UPI001FB15F67|nr:splicing factor 3B subunit 4 [Impatiens glandulifera]